MNEGVVELLTIDELVDELESLTWIYGITKYKLTEFFSKKGMVSFHVQDLTIEYDGDAIWFSDDDNVISDNYCVAMMFLRKSLLRIIKFKGKDNTSLQLLFRDGMITIESCDD